MDSEATFHFGSKHSLLADISVIAFCLPTIPCSNCAGSGLSHRFIRVETGRRVAQTHSKAPITLPHPLHPTRTHGRLNQSLSEPFGSLSPRLLASGSRQYPVFHCAKLWSGSVGPPGPASPTLSMHGSPQLSFYFRSMEAYLGPAGASETMGMLPYLNTGSQTIRRTPESQ